MKDSILDFLCTSLIPELCSNISTSTSCNIHLILITVSAVRAFPYKLSVIISYNLNLACVAAFLTIITLRIQFRIHDIIINKTDYLKNRRNVVSKEIGALKKEGKDTAHAQKSMRELGDERGSNIKQQRKRGQSPPFSLLLSLFHITWISLFPLIPLRP